MALDPRRFTEAQYKFTAYSVTVPAGTKYEDLLKQDFLSNMAAKLRQYDRILVSIDTGEWFAEFIVTACSRTWAKLHPVYKLDLVSKEGESVEMDDETHSQFEVKHRGPHLKWCVIRKSDKEPIKEQCENRQEAQAWLASYILTL